MKVAPRITAEANDNIKGLIREAILANTDVRIEVDEGSQNDNSAQYIAKG
jgi:hypothetical protein